MWLSHPTFHEVVRDAWSNHTTLPNAIASFTSKAQVWNKNQFGNIFHKKKRICARLRGIQIALGNGPNEFLIELERSLRSDLAEISKLEADFWSMKAHISWVVEGDENSTFFHTSALVRRRRNRMVNMKDRMGNWLNNEQDIVNFIRRGFLELFITSHYSFSLEEWHPPFLAM